MPKYRTYSFKVLGDARRRVQAGAGPDDGASLFDAVEAVAAA